MVGGVAAANPIRLGHRGNFMSVFQTSKFVAVLTQGFALSWNIVAPLALRAGAGPITVLEGYRVSLRRARLLGFPRECGVGASTPISKCERSGTPGLCCIGRKRQCGREHTPGAEARFLLGLMRAKA